MLTAVHSLVYSDDPAATRAFFRDVLRWPFVSEGQRGDEGVGDRGTGGTDAAEWLIFGTGPSELGVHETSGVREGQRWSTPRHHSIALMCDDLDATMRELRSRGAEFRGAATDEGFGLVARLLVPGADDLLVYEPRHARAYDLPARVVTATRTVAAPASEIFELIADPVRQPEWDGNDNLGEASAGQRVTRVGDTFVMVTTKGKERHNHVVEFDEGRVIAWRPSEPGKPPPGHLWRWDVEPVDATHTRVTHTYDWTRLTDEKRMPRARATTSERLRASVDRLAALAEGSQGPT